MITKTLNTEHVNAMVKALKASKCFGIEKTRQTVIVRTISTKKKNIEVFRALKHSGVDMWIIRHHEKLFI